MSTYRNKNLNIVVLTGWVCLISSCNFELGSTSVNPPGAGQSVLTEEFNEHCLVPEAEFKPVWECYEITVSDVISDELEIRHASGETHKTITFVDDGQTKFRFTPSLPGVWTFSMGGSIEIASERPDYAKGFVVAAGTNWVRSATREAFVPQFVMYERADLDSGLEVFLVEHGFTGFHIPNLRDFLKNSDYFEAVILKTYRLGGTTHFWIWGDESRRLTPGTYGVDTDLLYREIAARLAPLPGWSVGYGFDLHEWATGEEVERFRRTLNSYTSYRHMIGARGYKNRYRSISTKLDYYSWEWHRPTLQDYRDHILYANTSPAFSEDRFRIRSPSRYPEKDYNFVRTRRGLWHSALSGGVANIWGYKRSGGSYSDEYPNKEEIRTYRSTIDRYFEAGMSVNNLLLKESACLEGAGHYLCYAEDIQEFEFSSNPDLAISDMIFIDTTSAYREISIENISSIVQLPYVSDWAAIFIRK